MVQANDIVRFSGLEAKRTSSILIKLGWQIPDLAGH